MIFSSADEEVSAHPPCSTFSTIGPCSDLSLYPKVPVTGCRSCKKETRPPSSILSHFVRGRARKEQSLSSPNTPHGPPGREVAASSRFVFSHRVEWGAPHLCPLNKRSTSSYTRGTVIISQPCFADLNALSTCSQYSLIFQILQCQ